MRRATTTSASPRMACALAAICATVACARSAPTAATPAASATVTLRPHAAVDEVIDRILAAHGGRERLARVRGYRAEGTTIAHLRGGPGLMTRTFLRPDRLRVVIDYGARREIRLLLGERGWRGDDAGALERVEGPPLWAMQLQAARAALPWLLDERRADVAMAPSAGADEVLLALAPSPGLILEVVVDGSTGFIMRTSGRVAEVPQIRFEARYTQRREIDGVWFPVVEESFASGMHTATTTLDTIIVNPDVGDELSPPTIAI